MAKPLDLEEQEQLDALKAFWARWGNFITWMLIAVFGTIAAYNGYQFWQKRVALQASGLYDQVEAAAQAGDLARVAQAVDAMKQAYSGATVTHQGGLVAAQVFSEKGDNKRAQTELKWVADNAKDEGLQAIARLRLSSLLLEEKAFDQAARVLDGAFPEHFKALVADRRGDMALLQGKSADAKSHFLAAYQGLSDDVDYKRLLAAKLESLGVEPPKTSSGSAASTAKASAADRPAAAASR